MTAYRMADPIPEPPGRRRRPVGAKVLMILGAVMVIGAVIAFSTGAQRVVDGGRKLQQRADRLRRDLVVELEVPGRVEVRLRPGLYNIYDVDLLANVEDPSSTAPTSTSELATTTTTPPVVTDAPVGPDGRPVPADPGSTSVPGTTAPGAVDLSPRDAIVTVTDASGFEMPQTSPGLSSLADAVGGELLAQQQIRIEQAGTYTVEATGADGKQIGIGRAESSGEVGRVVSGAFLTLAAVFLGGLGALAAVAGLIWFFVGGGSSSPAPGSEPMVGWTPPPPGGFDAGPPQPAAGGWPPPGTGWPGPAAPPPPPPPSPPSDPGAWPPQPPTD